MGSPDLHWDVSEVGFREAIFFTRPPVSCSCLTSYPVISEVKSSLLWPLKSTFIFGKVNLSRTKTKMESLTLGTKWRWATQEQLRKQNFTYQKLQKFAVLLRNQQRTPANPQTPIQFKPSLDCFERDSAILKTGKKTARPPIHWKKQITFAVTQ